MNRTCIGWDPSLTSSGYAYYNTMEELVTGRVKPGKKRGVDRLIAIRNAFERVLYSGGWEESNTPLVAYEGYSMGSARRGSPGRYFDIGELGGVLKVFAYSAGIDILLVPPASLKIFATGAGNCDKQQVVAAVERVWGIGPLPDDEADAFVLLKMAQAYVSNRPVRSKDRRRALEGCTVLPGKN